MVSKKILWADDEISQLKPHILFLEKKGYEVTGVNSGEDAIEECKKNHDFDLILMDEMMTGLDGLSTISIIKKDWPNIPIVMITKNEEEWLMEEAIGAHISNYLTKPVNPSQILMVCKNIFDNKKIQTDKNIKSFIKYFNDITINSDNVKTVDEWYEVYSNICNWSINLADIEDKNIYNMLNDQKKTMNSKFCEFVISNYKKWINNNQEILDKPILSHNIFDDYLKPIISKKRKLIFIIIDCLRLDQWKMISKLFKNDFSMKENFHLSILPTATPFARNAIFSGLLPNDLKENYPDLWKRMYNENKLNGFEDIFFERQLLKNNFKEVKHKYIKISDFKSGKKFFNKINDYKNIDVLNIVVNFVDILGHSRSESKVLSELIPNENAYRKSIFNWFENSWLLDSISIFKNWENTEIVITSDHGNTSINKPQLIKGDQSTSQGVRYKYGRNLRFEGKNTFKIDRPLDYNLPMFDINTEYIIATDNTFFVYNNDYHKFVSMYKNTFQHGGISMDEMIVPLISLNKK